MRTFVLLGTTLTVAGLAIACPPRPDTTPGASEIQMERAWAVVANDITAKKYTGPSGETSGTGVFGGWDPPQTWDVIAIHSALLPNGQVLQYSYPGGGTGSRARMWNPANGQFTDVDFETDIFCSGLTHLGDGRLYVTGGNQEGCDFKGRRITNFFDASTGIWTGGSDMVDGRWYPTNVTLADGRVLTFSGLALDCETNPLVEMYTPGAGLELVPNATRELALYPRMHVLSDGRLAHVGPESNTQTYTLDGGWTFIDWNNFGWRGDGTSVLIPGRTDEILVIGGQSSGVVTNTCEVIDFKSGAPQWAYAAPMHTARAHADAVILPDKTVIVIGGGQDGLYDAPVNTPELYDPATDTWTELPPHVHGRMYHATSILLPDGRILVAGQDSGQSAWQGEIYNPPYLFRGDRPTLTSAPADVRYGQTFSVASPDAASIDSAVLTRLGANTHSVHFQQRLVELAIVGNDASSLTLTMPGNPNGAPPGYYLLWIVNDNGVPGVAKFVLIEHAVAGDLDLDGDVDFQDLVNLLAAWGPCPPGTCVADLDGNGVVDFQDLVALLSAWS